jgi:hypothetical protein
MANGTFIAPRTELKIEGGGVWRLKMVDEGRSEGGVMRYRILASCMHAGKSTKMFHTVWDIYPSLVIVLRP